MNEIPPLGKQKPSCLVTKPRLAEERAGITWSDFTPQPPQHLAHGLNSLSVATPRPSLFHNTLPSVLKLHACPHPGPPQERLSLLPLMELASRLCTRAVAASSSNCQRDSQDSVGFNQTLELPSF